MTAPEPVELTDEEREALACVATGHEPDLCDCCDGYRDVSDRFCEYAHETFDAVERIIADRLAAERALRERVEALANHWEQMGRLSPFSSLMRFHMTMRADDLRAALAVTVERVDHEALREAVTSLADEWSSRWDVPEPGVLDLAAKHYRAAAKDLRAAFAAATTPTPPQTNGCCQACGGAGGASDGPCWGCRATGCAHPAPTCAPTPPQDAATEGGR